MVRMYADKVMPGYVRLAISVSVAMAAVGPHQISHFKELHNIAPTTPDPIYIEINIEISSQCLADSLIVVTTVK